MLTEINPLELRKIIRDNQSQNKSLRFQQLCEDDQAVFCNKAALVFEQMQKSYQDVVENWRDFRWVEVWRDGLSRVGGTIVFFDGIGLQREPLEVEAWRSEFSQWSREQKMSNSEIVTVKRATLRETLFALQQPNKTVLSKNGFKFGDPYSTPQDFYTSRRFASVIANRINREYY